MGTLWIPGAERIKPSTAGGTITSTAPPRVVWHTTEAPPGTDNMFQTMIRVLTNKGAEPQVLYDPVTDRLGQFMPLNVSGRALKNDGLVRSNRVGRACIQVEVIAYSKTPFTGYWKPGPNFRALMAAIRSWGIRDVFPMGDPPKYPGPSRRDRSIWMAKAGHYCHANIPGNDHGDPGAISVSKLFAAGMAVTPPSDTPTPVKEWDEMATEAQVESAAYKGNVRYGKDFWTAPTGTGTALIKAVAAGNAAISELARFVKADDVADDAAFAAAMAEIKAANSGLKAAVDELAAAVEPPKA